MARPASLVLLLLTVGLAAAQSAPAITREVECFALVSGETGSEAESLYLQRMGFGPEALRSFAPSRFERGPGGFTCRTEGVFGYQAGTPTLVARSGAVALYRLAATVRSSPPPRATKTVSIDLRLSDLAAAGEAEQPGIRAIDLAAAKLGWRGGRAWVLRMQWRSSGLLRVTVALAP